MHHDLLRFKGADWAGMVFGVISTVYLAKEKRVGFLYGILCGGGWLAFGFLTESVAGIISNLLLIGFNCHGWWTWKKKRRGS